MRLDSILALFLPVAYRGAAVRGTPRWTLSSRCSCNSLFGRSLTPLTRAVNRVSFDVWSLRHDQLFFETDPVLFHFLVQRRSVDPQCVGGLLTVPSVCFQGFDNQLFFGRGQR